ncbi:MAG: hypothetical protein QM532_00910 [Cyanobium sp. MAG06]|nr:hypothetical protein [Cyanobium sp. MAG06]
MIEQFYSHANIVLDEKVFPVIKGELLDNNSEVLCIEINIEIIKSKEKENKNLLMKDLSQIRRFITTKTINKRYIICNKRILNTAVQEALLKVLEEMDENIVFIIFTDSINYLLPTILSRCVLYNKSNILYDKDKINLYKEFKSERVDDYILAEEAIVKMESVLIKINKFKDLEKLLIVKNELIAGNITPKYVMDYLSIS